MLPTTRKWCNIVELCTAIEWRNELYLAGVWHWQILLNVLAIACLLPTSHPEGPLPFSLTLLLRSVIGWCTTESDQVGIRQWISPDQCYRYKEAYSRSTYLHLPVYNETGGIVWWVIVCTCESGHNISFISIRIIQFYATCSLLIPQVSVRNNVLYLRCSSK